MRISWLDKKRVRCASTQRAKRELWEAWPENVSPSKSSRAKWVVSQRILEAASCSTRPLREPHLGRHCKDCFGETFLGKRSCYCLTFEKDHMGHETYLDAFKHTSNRFPSTQLQRHQSEEITQIIKIPPPTKQVEAHLYCQRGRGVESNFTKAGHCHQMLHDI